MYIVRIAYCQPVQISQVEFLMQYTKNGVMVFSELSFKKWGLECLFMATRLSGVESCLVGSTTLLSSKVISTHVSVIQMRMLWPCPIIIVLLSLPEASICQMLTGMKLYRQTAFWPSNTKKQCPQFTQFLLDLVYVYHTVTLSSALNQQLYIEDFHPAPEISGSFDVPSSTNKPILSYNTRKLYMPNVRQWIECLNYPGPPDTSNAKYYFESPQLLSSLLHSA